jgi:transcriptional regulator with XRE-family HTH domain
MNFHKLKSLREAKGYSQEYMASQCKIDQSSYSRMESGKIKPDLDKIKIIAQVLELDLSTLLSILVSSEAA